MCPRDIVSSNQVTPRIPQTRPWPEAIPDEAKARSDAAALAAAIVSAEEAAQTLQAVEARASTAERELASMHQSLSEETARLVAEREAAEVGAISVRVFGV